MPIARGREAKAPRVIAHVDMDCFYVQVEQRKNPLLKGLPTAVVQYNAWKGGGLIAVGYEARKFGVTRSMRGDEAKSVCPEIKLVQVPVGRGKADLSSYRSAGSEVVEILAEKGKCERASIDEVYLDLTDAARAMLLEAPPEFSSWITDETLKSNILGITSETSEKENNVRQWFHRPDASHEDKLLACGAIIVADLRMKVLEQTKFTCSAGIAHNKMLAKLASGMHKPAQQTVVPSTAVSDLLSTLPVKKMKQLGGKLGTSLQNDLGVNTVGDLLNFREEKFQELYGINTGTWLWKIARGIDGEEVHDRLLPKSHGTGKNFPGPSALRTISSVKNWLDQLCEELSERLDLDLHQNKRIAHSLTLHATAFKETDLFPEKKFPSKSRVLRYGILKIKEDAMRLFETALQEFLGFQNIGWGVTSLSVTASKIFEIPCGTSSILDFLHPKSSSAASNHSLGLSSSDCTEQFMQHEISSSTDVMTKGQNGDDFTFSSEKQLKNHITVDQCESRQHTGISNSKADKSACSILRFFSGNSSRPLQTNVADGFNHDMAETRDRQQHGKNPEGELSMSTSSYCHAHGQWNIKVEDIDPSVLKELPLELQQEIQGWANPPNRARLKRRGPTISDYFLPTKRQEESG